MSYNSNIQIHEVPFMAPFTDGINRSSKLSKYFTFGELWDSVKVLDKQENWDNGIPLHKDIPLLHEIIREQLGSPIYVGSSFRSYEWELSKNRSGNSQHVSALAIDLNGVGLVKLIETAIQEKNDLYKTLRQLGVNAFGFYSWGVHFDFRSAKSNGDIFFWDERKKKSESVFYWLILFLFSMWFAGRLRKIKMVRKILN
jgi:hypothetical protein